jgi:aminoglycoside phosphotransferase (APT) family kinase protein
LEGRDATVETIDDLNSCAIQLAQFIAALQKIDQSDAPQPGDHNFFRGVQLNARDARTRESIAQLSGLIDTTSLTHAWEQSLAAAPEECESVWIHGDLQPGNLIVRDGQLSAVVDFGGLAAGDPACDLMIAWTLFQGDSRNIFRQALNVDDSTWLRGRGWALSVALIALPYYLNSNATIVRISQRALSEVLADA